MLTRLGVLGWPVRHSRSPAMQSAALAALGLRDWHYQHLPVPPGLFDETVRALPAAGFTGANVTIPHKEAALALADTATDAARAIGAANTLTFRDGAIHADNTDAPGLLAILPQPPEGRTALVLGAGGSARAAVWALTRAGAQVRIHNRTRERAERLARELGATVADRPEPADLLVNCTSVGLTRGDPAPADPHGYETVVDLVYRAEGTALIAEARAAGVPCADGLSMLVHQGALSLEAWTGLQAPLAVMESAARDVAPREDQVRDRQ